MRWGLLVGLVAVVAMAGAATAGPATPAPEGAPFVDAGLDQQVYVGDQVYLDGGGTWDDQGDITSTEWTIEAPDGTEIQPECPDCWFTNFIVNQTGQYDATLTVRDAEGHVNSDTLYVTVQALEADMLPEVPNETGGGGGGSNGGGGGDDDGCWVSHSGTGDSTNPLSDTLCSNHGTFLGYEDANMGEVSEGNYRRFAVFEDDELADEYPGTVKGTDGTVYVPSRSLRNNVESIWEEYKENEGGDSVNTGGGNNNNNNGGGGGRGGTIGGDNRPTGGDAIGIGPSHGSCNAPCGANS